MAVLLFARRMPGIGSTRFMSLLRRGFGTAPIARFCAGARRAAARRRVGTKAQRLGMRGTDCSTAGRELAPMRL